MLCLLQLNSAGSDWFETRDLRDTIIPSSVYWFSHSDFIRDLVPVSSVLTDHQVFLLYALKSRMGYEFNSSHFHCSLAVPPVSGVDACGKQNIIGALYSAWSTMISL